MTFANHSPTSLKLLGPLAVWLYPGAIKLACREGSPLRRVGCQNSYNQASLIKPKNKRDSSTVLWGETCDPVDGVNSNSIELRVSVEVSYGTLCRMPWRSLEELYRPVPRLPYSWLAHGWWWWAVFHKLRSLGFKTMLLVGKYSDGHNGPWCYCGLL